MDLEAQSDSRRKHLIVLAITIAIAQITYYYKLLLTSRAEKVPYHTSILTGKAWVIELITGHPDRIKHNFGVHLEVFESLVQTLHKHGFVQSRNGISVDEQLGIFLYTCVTRLSSRLIGERFQHSPDTITR